MKRTRFLISVGDGFLADPAPDDTGILLTQNEHKALKFVTFERACQIAKIAAQRTDTEPRVLSYDYDY